MTQTATTSARRSPGEARRLLARLEAWPLLRLERRGVGTAALYFCGGDRAIGGVDERTGVLTVNVDHAFAGALLERNPELQAAPSGVRLRPTGAQCSAAEALLRWRIDLERFAPQLRDASP